MSNEIQPGKIKLCTAILIFKKANTQSLSHPVIGVTSSEKAEILNKINSVSRAGSLNTPLHSTVDATKNSIKSNPAILMNSMPAL